MVAEYRSLTRDVVFAMSRLRNHVVNYATVYVRETFLASLMEIGKTLMVLAHEVKNGGMDVMNMRSSFNCFEAKVVGSAVSRAALNSGACHPH